MAVKPIPDGFHTITPYLIVEGAEKLRRFVKEAFGAEELHCSHGSDGRIMHAQFRIGDSFLMASDATAEWKAMPGSIYLYVPDVDAVYEKAMAAGAVSLYAPRNEFYGDRCSGVKDPVGNCWWISTHVEDVTPEEMERRMKALGDKPHG